ncbi:MAG: RIP metalloprotease RseP [Desulfobulbus propionicus]|nr:MAG: RIP metalloprotease RseP [Desulfobulbus propionicus]
MNSLLSFILVLGVLIFVHELGHFLLAKAFGVKVLTFSLGFGNKVVSRQWGETEYQIGAFPLGGFVRMYGEQADETVDADQQHRSFSHKPIWQRFGIVFGGPLFNLLFAVILFWGMLMITGLPEAVDTTLIGEISAGSAAQQAGLQVDDRILQLNGKKMQGWADISTMVRESGGKSVELVVERAGETLFITATPSMEKVKNIFGEEVGERYLLGIVRKTKLQYKAVSSAEAGKAALLQTWDLTHLTIMGIIKMIQRIIPASELGGPIRIAEIAGQQLEAGWLNLLYFMGLLSVNLGVLNLLPVPVLDGGHLVFLTIEAIRRKPLGERTMEVSQKIGIALLGSLMIFVFYNDIMRIIQRWLTS